MLLLSAQNRRFPPSTLKPRTQRRLHQSVTQHTEAYNGTNYLTHQLLQHGNLTELTVLKPLRT